jgi:anti-sigma regulatory factor (Ser/Thr protein kinase)
MSVRAARKFVRQAIGPIAWAVPRLSDIELATSEMSTNAVEYGEGGSFAVTVEIQPGRVDVSVHSAGSHHTPAVQMSGNSTLSGRGLRIVSTVAEQFNVDQSTERVIVRCTFLRDASATEQEHEKQQQETIDAATTDESPIGPAAPDSESIVGSRSNQA